MMSSRGLRASSGDGSVGDACVLPTGVAKDRSAVCGTTSEPLLELGCLGEELMCLCLEGGWRWGWPVRRVNGGRRVDLERRGVSSDASSGSEVGTMSPSSSSSLEW